MTTLPSDTSAEPGPPSTPASKIPSRRQGDWRGAFFKTVSPGIFTGIRAGDWIRLLAQNRFRVEPAYWPKAACTTFASLITSAFNAAETRIYAKQIAATEVPPPLFVLGHWRSGTTHLHNLLALDGRFQSPRFSEVTIPHTFLTGEWLLNAFLKVLLPSTRFEIDNVPLGIDAPSEEEFALAQMTLCSPYLGWAFPAGADRYNRFVSFRDASAEEIAAWKRAMLTFVRKLTFRHGAQVVIKSPANTARIRMLLDIFPNARFVHIHRDPYTVYKSTRHLHTSSWKTFAFQTLNEKDLQERILWQYQDLYEAFFEDRELIPQGHFTELSFQELESDPVGQVERIYRDLSLGDFDAVRGDVEQYVAGQKGYRKNRHVDLPQDLRERIAVQWRRSFEEWGYPV